MFIVKNVLHRGSLNGRFLIVGKKGDIRIVKLVDGSKQDVGCLIKENGSYFHGHFLTKIKDGKKTHYAYRRYEEQ